MTPFRRWLVSGVLVVAIVSCSGSANVVQGIVIAVDGNLVAVDSFVVRLADGSDRTFVPMDGLLFHGDAPLSHIREHLVSGTRIEVRYEELQDGTLVALEVDDAG